jgi:hypothetical protein
LTGCALATFPQPVLAYATALTSLTLSRNNSLEWRECVVVGVAYGLPCLRRLVVERAGLGLGQASQLARKAPLIESLPF